MGKKEETVWDLTPDQFRILTNASRLNPIVYISKDFGGLITADQMDLALDTFYMNKKFDYKLEQSFVIHNLNEVLKTLKTIEKGKIVVEPDRLVVVDKEDRIRCKFLHASPTLVAGWKKEVFPKIDEGIERMKSSGVEFNFSSSCFATIKKFFNPVNHDTLAFFEDKIVLFGGIGAGKDLNIRDTIEIKVSDKKIFSERIDVSTSILKTMEEGDYTCYVSKFVLFVNEENGNVYGRASEKRGT